MPGEVEVMVDHPMLADGRYVVQRCVGQGGMAAVFLVYDNTFKLPRAIKVLKPSLVVRPESRTRFRTEAMAMARLNHPNIVRVFDHGMEGMTSYIVMEYFPHGSLHGYLRAHGPLSREVALSLALDLTDALAHAHQAGVIHRDIKPENVLLSPGGAQLTDFGLARVSSVSMGVTRTRAIMGTPSYMSPEQRLSARRSNHLTDIYALTATLFSMFSRADPVDLFDAAAQDVLLQSFDADLAAVIRKGCHPEQDARFQSATALGEALEALRETPHAPRTRITPLPMGATNAPPVDLPTLHRLWASYTSPSQEPAPPPANDSATISIGHFSTAEPAPTVPSQPPETAPAPAPTPSVPPRRRPAGALLLLFGVLGVGGLAWNAVQSPPAEEVPAPVPLTLQPSLIPAEDPRLNDALDALLEVDVHRAQPVIDALVAEYPAEPAVHAAQAMMYFLMEEPRSATVAIHRAAVFSADRSDPMSRLLRLAGNPGIKRMEPFVVRAHWASICMEANTPVSSLLYQMATWSLADEPHQRVEIDRARMRHPDTAVFAWLDVRWHQASARTPAEHEGVMALLDEALVQFPTSAMLLTKRSQLLLQRGQLDAAAEVGQQVLRLTDGLIQTRIDQANIDALQDNEADRMTQFMLAISDTVPLQDQRMFMLEHGLLLASQGQLTEAEKLWQFGIDQTDSVVNDAQRLAYEVPILSAQLRLHAVDGPAWTDRRDRVNQYLQSAELSFAQRSFWSSEVQVIQAVHAARRGQPESAADLILELSPTSAHENLVRLEHALAVLAPVASEWSILLESFSGLPREACFTAWATARISVATDAPLASIQEATVVLDEHDCIAPLPEWSLQRAQALLLEAERAMAVGQREVAQRATERFRAHWPRADADLPFVTRIAAVEGWLQAP